MRILGCFLAIVSLIFMSTLLYAADAVVVSPDTDFINAVFALVKGWGGLSSAVKISSVITLVISTFKVSYFKGIWNSLKITINGKVVSFQMLAVPVLSIVIGLIGQGNISLQAIVAYCVMGAGAVYFHELLDIIKELPIASPIFKVIMSVITSILGGNKA
jgi:hypothetical protein